LSRFDNRRGFKQIVYAYDAKYKRDFTMDGSAYFTPFTFASPRFLCHWGGRKLLINQDLERYKEHFHYEKCPYFLYLLYLLATDRYFRQIFYNRIGPIATTLTR